MGVIILEKILVFGKYDSEEVEVSDVGLQRYINLRPIYVPHTMGRHEHRRFRKSTVPIVERFANKLLNGGDRNDKKFRTGKNSGKKARVLSMIEQAFDIIHFRTGLNPIQVLVKAIENAAPAEETTRISYGGMAYPRSGDIGPQRRIDLALRMLVTGILKSTHNNTKSLVECMVDELLAAYRNDPSSYAVSKKDERERIARSAR